MGVRFGINKTWITARLLRRRRKGINLGIHMGIDVEDKFPPSDVAQHAPDGAENIRREDTPRHIDGEGVIL